MTDEFEKEAEEKYCNGCKLRMEQCLWAWRNTNGLKEPNEKNCSCKEVPIYIRGATFGYSKANEWSYPSKGELPKDEGLLMSKTLLLIIKMKGSDCSSLALGQYNFSTQEFSYQHIVGLTDVIAWKEIVLPELPKESE